MFLIAFLLQFATSQPIIVKVSEFAPCVMECSGKLCGFDIDLFECLAKEVGVQTKFEKVEQFEHIFDDVIAGKADAAIAGISITFDRESKLDFTHHYLDSGLKILVRSGEEQNSAVNWIMLKSFFYLICLLIIGGILLWFIESKLSINGNIKRIEDGVNLAFASASTIGYGNFYPVTRTGFVCCLAIFITGAMSFANVISSLSAEKTVVKLSQINSPEDLARKKVATIKGTTSVDAIKRLRANVVETVTIEEACEKLLNKEVDAVVYDAPSLQYYVASQGDDRVVLLPFVFDKQFYGIALTENTKLREPLNQALLRIQENGTYDAIYKKWFGNHSHKR